ncbi:hypothetical protein ACDH60_24985 [Pseudomonas ficuserectae]|uniref:hypothetical protein n=1 Tax=Pseudomonas syringae group genomosp. 2 TaxID=251698 RepID=UPI000A9E64FF|nr:hypothetical protein [Pseudomonas amygdali]QWA50995.1 hypothetical protein C4C37_04470 [Pseudomonas amygdali pv. lachrymans]RMM51122.1 hypothetical protein ALQ79_200512 [Pseudomonas amygdali pv. lachrymans]RMT03484.1 hypothetical protein ALP54_200087 [Pseudomonas amygdali pv. lachrymans]WIO59125.1 hypothetical protein QO021_04845 [Pseudomonas amygdali pv. lachrymans]WIO59958.1 hypothetical protein QO021_09560 [Pseudomonas amygdali pv. lachrymans]
MTSFIELTKESLAPHLHEAISQCLTEKPHPSAWLVDDIVLIDAAALSALISIALNPLPRRQIPSDLADLLLQLELVSRPQRYVLRYDSKFGGRARWRPLLQLAKGELPDNTLLDAFPWFCHEVEDHPFMALGIPGDIHATRPQANRWRLALLLPDPSTLASHHRPSPALPAPHAVIATYREESFVGSDQETRSAGE